MDYIHFEQPTIRDNCLILRSFKRLAIRKPFNFLYKYLTSSIIFVYYSTNEKQ